MSIREVSQQSQCHTSRNSLHDYILKESYAISSSSHLEQVIVLNEYCIYNKPIPKISHVKTLQNLCNMRYNITIRKSENKLWHTTVYFSNVDCEAIRAQITHGKIA